MLSLQDIAGDSGELDFKALKEEIVANGKVICPMQGCDEDFRSLWGLKRHLRQFHCDSEKREGSGKFNCNKCSRSFQTRVALRKHSVEVHSVGSETEGTSLSSPGFSSPRYISAGLLHSVHGRVASGEGGKGGSCPPPKKNTIEEYQKPKERLGSLR